MATLAWVDGWTGKSIADHLGLEHQAVLLIGDTLHISGIEQAAVDAAMKSYVPPTD